MGMSASRKMRFPRPLALARTNAQKNYKEVKHHAKQMSTKCQINVKGGKQMSKKCQTNVGGVKKTCQKNVKQMSGAKKKCQKNVKKMSGAKKKCRKKCRGVRPPNPIRTFFCAVLMWKVRADAKVCNR